MRHRPSGSYLDPQLDPDPRVRCPIGSLAGSGLRLSWASRTRSRTRLASLLGNRTRSRIRAGRAKGDRIRKSADQNRVDPGPITCGIGPYFWTRTL
jgi:hypothetical protein